MNREDERKLILHYCELFESGVRGIILEQKSVTLRLAYKVLCDGFRANLRDTFKRT